MNVKRIVELARRKFLHLRLRPIRVFCLHQVSPVYDPLRCCEGDWISQDSFMKTMNELRKKYTFLSLPVAHQRLTKDFIRIRNYAVLTFDDGYRSVLPSLKWLDSQMIPFTLFLNGKYMDGESCSPHILDNANRIIEYISEEELSKDLYLKPEELVFSFSTVGSHGFEHDDATTLLPSFFADSIKKNTLVLKQQSKCWIPYHAYTWGRHNQTTDVILLSLGIIPVLIDGGKNYNDPSVIHRELFPSS